MTNSKSKSEENEPLMYIVQPNAKQNQRSMQYYFSSKQQDNKEIKKEHVLKEEPSFSSIQEVNEPEVEKVEEIKQEEDIEIKKEIKQEKDIGIKKGIKQEKEIGIKKEIKQEKDIGIKKEIKQEKGVEHSIVPVNIPQSETQKPNKMFQSMTIKEKIEFLCSFPAHMSQPICEIVCQNQKYIGTILELKEGSLYVSIPPNKEKKVLTFNDIQTISIIKI
ncbi:CotO family spore coat protein [Priestia megaterium]|uniref:CotO family spore coat protein n=1 Tax=Priestia megaterium TaxID=1404 RepID=UPI0023DC4E0C|nr:CotO family spore coat protein [Priestia megaterium]MDF2015511.1 CotO family spore coat protein [Priestia megaterium]